MTGSQFVVVGIDLATDTYQLYINPTLGETAPAMANATATYADTDTLNTLRYVVHSTLVAGDPSIDEIRVGTTFADVVGVPEPATIGLAATAGLLALRRRRAR